MARKCGVPRCPRRTWRHRFCGTHRYRLAHRIPLTQPIRPFELKPRKTFLARTVWRLLGV